MAYIIEVNETRTYKIKIDTKAEALEIIDKMENVGHCPSEDFSNKIVSDSLWENEVLELYED